MKETMKKFGGIAVVTSFVLVPSVAFAQDFNNVEGLVEGLADIVALLIPVAFALILLVFFWGLAKYVLNESNEDAREQGKRIMIGGIIALFVAAAVWGIVEFLADAIGVDTGEEQESPGVLDL